MHRIKRLLYKLTGRKRTKQDTVAVKATPKERVERLIESLHPIKSQYDLIRIGPEGDGGYLVPDDLDGIQACFSPGVANISEFELQCYQRGMAIYMADKSVDKVNLSIPSNQYDFTQKFIGSTTNNDYMTLDAWVNTHISDPTQELLLQMDIEGGEYDSLINASDELLSRFRIMVIEFHSLHELWNSHFFRFATLVFSKILQTHTCVHIHPNNCCSVLTRLGIDIPRTMEFTFLRNDRIASRSYTTTFPHVLDRNNTSRPPVTLPVNWYRHKSDIARNISGSPLH